MQVNSLPPPGLTRSGDGRSALLPNLIQLLQRSAEDQARHEESVRQREDRLCRRKDEHQENAAAAATTPRPSDVMRQAERDMRPGSTTARAEQRNAQAQQQARERQADFRQTLNRASDPGNGPRDAARPVPDNGHRPPAAAPNAPKPDSTPKAASTKIADGPAMAAAQRPSAESISAARPMPTAGTPTLPAGGTPTLPASAGKPNSAAVAAVGRAAAPTATGGGARAAQPVATFSSGPEVMAARKAPAASASRPTAEPAGSSDANVERILRLIHSRIGKDRSVATLRLDPPELGTVRVHMDLRHENLSLRVETQTPAAHRLLSEQIETLRQGLEATGLHLDRIEVLAPVAADATESHPQPPDVPFDQQHAPAQRDTHSAGGGGHGEPESPSGEWSEEESPATSRWSTTEPAAESLVNIWA